MLAANAEGPRGRGGLAVGSCVAQLWAPAARGARAPVSLAIHGVTVLPPAHPRPSLRRVPMCTPGHHCPRPSRNYGRRDRGVAAVPSGPGNLDRRLRCGGRRDERRVAPRQGGKPWPLIGGSPAVAAWSRPTNKSLGKALGKNGSSCRLLKKVDYFQKRATPTIKKRPAGAS